MSNNKSNAVYGFRVYSHWSTPMSKAKAKSKLNFRFDVYCSFFLTSLVLEIVREQVIIKITTKPFLNDIAFTIAFILCE